MLARDGADRAKSGGSKVREVRGQCTLAGHGASGAVVSGQVQFLSSVLRKILGSNCKDGAASFVIYRTSLVRGLAAAGQNGWMTEES